MLFENIALGAEILLRVDVLFLIFGGTLLGLIFGAVPGLTTTLAIVLLLPLTYGLDAAAALALLCAIFVGGVSGGLVSACLLNMPGTPDSIATTFDGHPIARDGRPGRALSLGIVASFFGGIFSLVLLVMISPLMAAVALRMHTFEYFILAVFGLTVVASLAEKAMLKGFIAAALGVLLATIGVDPLSSSPRYTLGFERLQSGFHLIPALVGLYIVSEAFTQIARTDQRFIFKAEKLTGTWLTVKDITSQWWNLVRSSAIGSFLGMLPGVGGSVANFVAYDQAKKASRTPERFGKGAEEGVVAPEASNNAITGAAFIPMLSLGIPGNTVTAVILGGLIMHGVTPGPALFRDELPLVYSLFGALLLANIAMVILQYTVMIRFFTWALRVPKTILIPLILSMAIAGVYSIRSNLFDVWTIGIFGVLGYVMVRLRFPLPPLILGLILGPIMETHLRSAMMATGGDLTPFITRPYSLTLVALTVFSIGFSIYMRYFRKSKPPTEGVSEKLTEI